MRMQPNNHYCVTGMNVNELKPNMILHSLRVRCEPVQVIAPVSLDDATSVFHA